MENERLAKIEEKVDVILNNHLSHIQASLAVLETNIGWLMKFFWLITTISVGSAIAQILSALHK